MTIQPHAPSLSNRAGMVPILILLGALCFCSSLGRAQTQAPLVPAAPATPPTSVISGAPQSGPQATPSATGEGQLDPELKKRAYAWLDELITESGSLASPESQLSVQIKAIDLLWKQDEPRARAMVRDATAQIISLIGSLPTLNSPGPEQSYVKYGSAANLRRQLLSFLTNADVDLALEFMRATRSSILSETGYPGADPEEKLLESRLVLQAARKDPQRAARMIEEMMSGDLTPQVVELWNQVRQKDPALGAKLAAQILGKLKTTDLLHDQEKLNTKLYMLQMVKSQMASASEPPAGSTGSTRKSPAVAPEAQALYVEILESMVGAALKVNTSNFINLQEAEKARFLLMNLKGYLADFDRYLPSQGAALRAKLTQFDQALYYNPQQRDMEEYQQKIQDKSAPELLAMAATAPREVRELVYMQAMNKALEQGDKDAARQIAKEHLPNASYLLASLDQEDSERAIKEGKFDEARKYISPQAPAEERALALAHWASLALDRKDEKTARQYLDEARVLVGDQLRTRWRMEAQLALAPVYLRFDPDRSFEIAAASIERLNQVLAATLEVASFSGMADGESIIGPGELEGLAPPGLTPLAAQLARHDLDRTKGVYRGWRIDEVRVAMGLNLLQALLGGSNNLQVAGVEDSLLPSKEFFFNRRMIH